MTTRSFDVDIDRNGSFSDPSQIQALLDGLYDATDVILIAAGWSNDRAESAALSDEFIRTVEIVARSGVNPELSHRRLAAVRVFWPSRKLDESDTPEAGAARLARPDPHAAILRLLDTLKADSSVDRLVERAKALTSRLDTPAGREEFVQSVRLTLDPDGAHGDDGSVEFFEASPESLFDRLRGDASPGSVHEETPFGLLESNEQNELLAAAHRIVSYANYYQLKTLADRVGRTVGILLAKIKDRQPDRGLHLVGHSFGGRVAAAAAATLPPGASRVTLTLLQPAISQYAFAPRFDLERDGQFRTVVADARISGPLLMVNTTHDPEGRAYPHMARLMRPHPATGLAARLGDEFGPSGAMGRGGAQRTPEAVDLSLQPVGAHYRFTGRRIFNLQGDQFVSGRGGMAGAEVAHAFLTALATDTSDAPASPGSVALDTDLPAALTERQRHYSDVPGRRADLTPNAPDLLDPLVLMKHDSAKTIAATLRAAAPGLPQENHIVRVFYGTSRGRSDEEGDGIRYTSERGEDLTVGFVDVSVPSGHRRGHIERPSIWRLEWREDRAKHVVIIDVLEASTTAFFEAMRGAFIDSGTDATFVFIHGYNVRFEEAARRTAQLGYDLGIAVPAMFSWPSGGLLRDYIADGTVAEWSVPFLVSFLRDIRASSGARVVHVIAHSMGNRVLAGALAALREEASGGPLFQQVVLTAPDIDAAVFEQQIAPKIRPLSVGMTLYASSADTALQIAHRVHRARRAGDAGEDVVIVNGIDTIDATKVSTGFGHSAFGDVRTVVEDISLLLRLGLPPGQRNLTPLHRGPATYWEFPS